MKNIIGNLTVDGNLVVNDELTVNGRAIPTKTSDLTNDSGFVTNKGTQVFNRGTDTAQSKVIIHDTDLDALTVQNLTNENKKTVVSSDYVWIRDSSDDVARINAQGILGFDANRPNGYTINFPTTMEDGNSGEMVVNNSPENYGVAIGYRTNATNHSVHIGSPAFLADAEEYGVKSQGSVAIGLDNYVGENANYSIAVGFGAGSLAEAGTAIGLGAAVAEGASNAVQIGAGTNSTAGTLKFRDYPLVNADGIIPNVRIPLLYIGTPLSSNYCVSGTYNGLFASGFDFNRPPMVGETFRAPIYRDNYGAVWSCYCKVTGVSGGGSSSLVVFKITHFSSVSGVIAGRSVNTTIKILASTTNIYVSLDIPLQAFYNLSDDGKTLTKATRSQILSVINHYLASQNCVPTSSIDTTIAYPATGYRQSQFVIGVCTPDAEGTDWDTKIGVILRSASSTTPALMTVTPSRILGHFGTISA